MRDKAEDLAAQEDLQRKIVAIQEACAAEIKYIKQ
jgi:hypothetical protein